MVLAIRTASALPAKPARPLRTVRRTPLTRDFNARGIGLNVDTYA